MTFSSLVAAVPSALLASPRSFRSGRPADIKRRDTSSLEWNSTSTERLNKHRSGARKTRVVPTANGKGMFDNLPLPPFARNLARGVEQTMYFEGSPQVRLFPWGRKPKTETPGTPDPDDNTKLVLFDFSSEKMARDPAALNRTWGVLNDVVMGGSSEASIGIITIPQSEGGHCVKLSGNIEPELGGFVSMRCKDFVSPLDLSAYDGVSVRVRGDGSRFKFILRDTEEYFGLSFQSTFDTVEGEWMDVTLPFEALKPVMRGRVVVKGSSDFRNLRKDRLRSVQIMLSKYEYGMDELNPNFSAPGPFSLEVQRVGAYANVRSLASASAGAQSGGAASSSSDTASEL